MNKIVREHYPVSKLPEELRQGIEPGRMVTVTVVQEETEPEEELTLEEIWALTRPYATRSLSEIDRSIRKDRDDWERGH